MKIRNTSGRIDKGVLIGLGVALIAFIALVFVFLSGGVKGIIHNIKPLPNFTKGEPAVGRETYNQEVAAIDEQLSRLTEESYELAYIDTCERSQYNLKVKSDYLSSCEKRIQRVYLSNTPPCALLSNVKAIIGADENDVNSDRCPHAAVIFKYEGAELNNVTIELKEKRLALSEYSLFLAGVFSGDICPHVTYCKFNPGVSLNWPQIVQAENYPTILLLESSRTYYKE